jgi:uncharacterized protein Yka (UPF0111/DUF47 family)
MIELQFDLFKSDEETKVDTLHKAVEDIKKSSDKVRKGTYARINELTKKCQELESRLAIMEKNICKESTNGLV